jgi:hypothetical protein
VRESAGCARKDAFVVDIESTSREGKYALRLVQSQLRQIDFSLVRLDHMHLYALCMVFHA